MTRTGPQTEEVTWGRRKALRRLLDHRQRKSREAEERRWDDYRTTDRGSHVKTKKGTATITGPQTEEVTWGRRKALRRILYHRHRKSREAEERRCDHYWTTDRGSDMRPKKGATAISGPQTEEVTWGRRKALRRLLDQRQRKWHEAEERRYGH